MGIDTKKNPHKPPITTNEENTSCDSKESKDKKTSKFSRKSVVQGFKNLKDSVSRKKSNDRMLEEAQSQDSGGTPMSRRKSERNSQGAKQTKGQTDLPHKLLKSSTKSSEKNDNFLKFK